MPRLASRVFAQLLADDDGRMTAAELTEALDVSPAADLRRGPLPHPDLPHRQGARARLAPRRLRRAGRRLARRDAEPRPACSPRSRRACGRACPPSGASAARPAAGCSSRSRSSIPRRPARRARGGVAEPQGRDHPRLARRRLTPSRGHPGLPPVERPRLPLPTRREATFHRTPGPTAYGLGDVRSATFARAGGGRRPRADTLGSMADSTGARSESDLPIEPVYDASALAGFDADSQARRAGQLPVHPWRLPVDVHRAAVDDAAVRRLRHRQGEQRALPPARQGRHRRTLRRLRPADADGLRLRRADRARRGRQGRRRHRQPRRHAHPLRRAPARQDLDVDDDQRARLDAAAALPARRRGAGRRRRPADRHDPERRAQGVHRPRHLHLPAARVAAPHRRHLRLLPQGDAALEHHLHLRLPHGRGRGDARAGDRLHHRQRDRVRPRRPGRRAARRRLRAAPLLLLRRAHDPPRGGREVPRGPAHLGARS